MVLFDEKKVNKKVGKEKSQAVLDERNLITQRKMDQKKVKVLPSFADITPIIDISNNDFFEMRNGEYLEILQITSKDIYSLNESDKDNDIFSLTYFFQAYLGSVKIVPLNTPVNLELQKNNVIRRIRRNKVPAYLPFLEKKLSELEFLEKHRTDREFFIFVYAEDEKTLLERKTHVRKLLAQSNPVIELPVTKKVNVLYQLFNPNSKPKTD
ncbi:hypothetical protein [Sporosarcina sp. G11-34]|uniref:hypothetical protein n=1 Tax=Sporosarcina sp. G11-34 TaxID=2849605 RepID=UPI0022A9BD29|nr:hypothetical protein [Sporosarcina sp. G11-34]MCZ2260750.1 hypothetical protein [Sporosarcina sp. G11-34]